jgi:hypothetical protein
MKTILMAAIFAGALVALDPMKPAAHAQCVGCSQSDYSWQTAPDDSVPRLVASFECSGTISDSDGNGFMDCQAGFSYWQFDAFNQEYFWYSECWLSSWGNCDGEEAPEPSAVAANGRVARQIPLLALISLNDHRICNGRLISRSYNDAAAERVKNATRTIVL